MKFNAGHPPLLLNIIKSSYVAYLPPWFSSCRVRVLPSARSARGTKAEACGLFRGSSLPVLHAACSVSGTKQKIVSSRSGPWRSRSHSLSAIALNSSHHCANNHTPTKSQTVSQSSTVFAHFCTRSSHVDSTELSRICDSVQTNTTYPSCVSGAGSVPSSFHFHSCVCVHADGKQLKDAMIRFKQQTSYETVKTAWKSHFRCLRWYLWVYWWHHFDPV